MVGPGSQVEEEEMQYLDIPRDMRTFEMPRVPETGDTQALAAARDLLADILSRMNRWTPSNGNLRFDLRDIAPQALAVTNEMLGDGEVSIQVSGARRLRIQESVFTGVWRAVELDGDGRLVNDWIEAGALPAVAIAVPADAGGPSGPRARAAGRIGRDHVARLRQLPHHLHEGAQHLARAVFQQHEHADPEHDRGRRRP